MNTASLYWGVLFSALGLGYFVYARKQRSVVPFVCGLALMVVPYFISSAPLLVAVGACLAAIPFVVRS